MKPFQPLIALFILFFSMMTISYAVEDNTPSNFSNEQKQEIEKIVRQYLLDKPEVLVEASQILRQRQQKNIVEQATKAISANSDALFQSKSPVLGNPNGDVTLVEFFDYQCVHCKEMSPVLQKLIQNDKKLRIVMKNFPIFGEFSEKAARLALYAYQHNKYPAVHEALLQEKNRLSDNALMNIAKKQGLSAADVKKAMNSTEFDEDLKTNRQLGDTIGIMGTPAFIVALNPMSKDAKPVFVPGRVDYDTLKNLIAEARKQK